MTIFIPQHSLVKTHVTDPLRVMPQMQSPQVPRSAGGALVIAIDSLGSGLKDSNSVVAHKHATGCDTRKELTVCYPVSNNPDQPVRGRAPRALTRAHDERRPSAHSSMLPTPGSAGSPATVASIARRACELTYTPKR